MSTAIKHFDRDAYLAALEPPRFSAGGVTYIGRILSAEEWFPLEAKLESIGRENVTTRELLALVRHAADTIFQPERLGWRARTRGEKPKPSVASLVAQMPFQAQIDALMSFCTAQATAQKGTRLRPTTSPTLEVSSTADMPQPDAPTQTVSD